MKKLNLLAISAAVAGALVSGAAAADVTANFGATSNYLWRGDTLSNEAAAISGGADYSHASGAYAGIWVSSEGFAGATGETDLYVGYAGEAGDISYDVGYVSYMYTQVDTADFEEIYASVGYGPVSLFVANDSDNDNSYVSVSAEHGMFSITYGDYSFDAGGDYSHVDLGVALTDELSLTYSSNDLDGPTGDGRFVVSYGLEFDVK